MMSTPQGLSMRWHPVWRLALRVPSKSEPEDIGGNDHGLAPWSRELLKYANTDTVHTSMWIPFDEKRMGIL